MATRHTWTREEHEKILTLRRQGGATLDDVAKELGRTKSAIRSYIARHSDELGFANWTEVATHSLRHGRVDARRLEGWTDGLVVATEKAEVKVYPGEDGALVVEAPAGDVVFVAPATDGEGAQVFEVLVRRES